MQQSLQLNTSNIHVYRLRQAVTVVARPCLLGLHELEQDVPAPVGQAAD